MKGFRAWNAASGELAGSFATSSSLDLLAPESDMGVVESTKDEHGYAEVVRLSDGKSLRTIEGEGFPYIDWMTVSPDCTLLAMAGGCTKERVSPVFTPQLRVFQVSDGAAFCSVTQHIDSVRCLAFSGDSKLLYTASGWRDNEIRDCAVHAVDVATGAEVNAFGGLTEVPKAMAASRDGSRIWVLGEGGTLQCMDTGDGHERAKVGPLGQGLSLALSPDGKVVGVGLYNDNIVLVDASTGAVIRRLRRHQGAVMAIAFSPDSKRLASVSRDKTVRVWNVTAAGTGDH